MCMPFPTNSNYRYKSIIFNGNDYPDIVFWLCLQLYETKIQWLFWSLPVQIVLQSHRTWCEATLITPHWLSSTYCTNVYIILEHTQWGNTYIATMHDVSTQMAAILQHRTWWKVPLRRLEIDFNMSPISITIIWLCFNDLSKPRRSNILGKVCIVHIIPNNRHVQFWDTRVYCWSDTCSDGNNLTHCDVFVSSF
jgi:hypothetical protein